MRGSTSFDESTSFRKRLKINGIFASLFLFINMLSGAILLFQIILHDRIFKVIQSFAVYQPSSKGRL